MIAFRVLTSYIPQVTNSDRKNVAVFLILAAGFSAAFAREPADTNYAYYEGETYSYTLEAPDKWTLNLEDAYADGYTAALYPEEESYINSKMTIYIWIFKNDSYTFQDFISADSAHYLKEDENLEFWGTDSLGIDSGSYAIILQLDDPGGASELAMIGYINAVTEIVIFELHIADRVYFPEADGKFREALTKFSFPEPEDD